MQPNFPLGKTGAKSMERVTNSGPSIADVYPLSPMQQGILFHSVYDPASYFVQIHCRIRGPLHVPTLKSAWQSVLDRHSILRTTFAWKGLPEPLQTVHERVQVPWREEDWTHLPAAEQRQALDRYLANDQEAGFPFDTAPLLRLSLLQTGQDSYFFVWSSHHILYDAWCRELIIKEVFAYYESRLQQREPQLAWPRPYREYIAWINEQDLEDAETFWRAELKGFSVPTHLACDRGRPLEQAKERDEWKLLLSSDQTNRLVSAAKRLRFSLNTIVLGAWSLALSAYSGEQDLVFGTTVSGRSAPVDGIESMVGLFINTIPVRVQVRPGELAESFLRRVQLWQAKSMPYQLAPLAKMQSWSEVPRGTPLFQYLFLFQNYPAAGAIRERAGAKLEFTEIESTEWANYPLLLVAEPGPRLQLRLVSDKQRFRAHQILGLLETLVVILTGLVNNCACRIADIARLGEARRHRLLTENNDTEHHYQPTLCVHAMLDQKATSTPDAIAVRSSEGQLSYRTFKERSDQFANYLNTLGFGPEKLAALYVERSPDLLIGLVGILKAGGAYVPLDVNHPSERITDMLQSVNAPVLVTQKKLRSCVPKFAGEVVCLDGDWANRPQPFSNDSRCGREIDPQNLAYVIYTSGSTGKPKGVGISHEALSNYIHWAREVYAIDEKTVFCLYSSLAFDLTVTSLFTPLLAGGSIEVYAAKDGDPLLREIVQSTPADILKLTPSHLMTIRQLDNRQSTVRRFVVGGEALEDRLARQIFASFGAQVEIYNEYGPTEATVGCMIERWRPDQQETMVGIGRPAANAQIFILDAGMNPVVEGVGGELYIGGKGLARGYLGQPDLTAQSFLPDPFSTEPGARLYKTGDLARYQADGSLGYIGRKDRQVKVRGFRVELDEIEAALLENPAVREVKVTARKDGLGTLQVAAYLLLKQSEGFSVERMRRYLGEKLPAYMIPTAFLRVEQWPLTQNGKLDLAALAALHSQQRPELECTFVAPQAKMEQQIAAIWRNALDLSSVGIHDNFFDLGGHSILLMQVHHEIEKLVRQPLAITELFHYPTIRSLANYLTQKSPALPDADERLEDRNKSQNRMKQALRLRNKSLSEAGGSAVE
jgi:amino acid adenylation domain-containing protein